MDDTIKLKTRFIINYGDGLSISGFPGLGFDSICAATQLSIEEALQLYNNAISHDTEITIDPVASINELHVAAMQSLMPGTAITQPQYLPLMLVSNHECARFEHERMTVEQACLAFEPYNQLYVCIRLQTVAGEVLRGIDKGFRYYIHSRERGKHSYPHVHVDYKHRYSGVKQIGTGEVRDGNLPEGLANKATKTIIKHSAKFLDYWNKHTDGITFDPNVYLGLTAVAFPN